MNFEGLKKYKSPFIEIFQLETDVVTASSDPAVDDGYGDFEWGV